MFFDGGDGLGIDGIDLIFCDELLLVELEGGVELVAKRLDFCVTLEPLFKPLDKLHLSLGTLLVVPEAGSLCAELLFFVLYLLIIDVEVAMQLLCALLDFL